MEPLLNNPKDKWPLLGTFACGYLDDGQKVPLGLFLHVNDLTAFQSAVIPIFMGVHHDKDDIARSIAAISDHINRLAMAGFKPSRAEGDAVNQPDHYKRFKIEPTFYNQENGVDWCRGNALKYVCRFPFKNGLEDLRKAMRCLEMYLRWMSGEEGWSK